MTMSHRKGRPMTDLSDLIERVERRIEGLSRQPYPCLRRIYRIGRLVRRLASLRALQEKDIEHG